MYSKEAVIEYEAVFIEDDLSRHEEIAMWHGTTVSTPHPYLSKSLISDYLDFLIESCAMEAKTGENMVFEIHYSVGGEKFQYIEIREVLDCG